MQGVHDLKVWPSYFQDMWDGNKVSDVRKDDRGYFCGDRLVLREWNPGDGPAGFTGRHLEAIITHVQRMDVEPIISIMGRQVPDVVVLSLRITWREQRPQPQMGLGR